MKLLKLLQKHFHIKRKYNKASKEWFRLLHKRMDSMPQHLKEVADANLDIPWPKMRKLG